MIKKIKIVNHDNHCVRDTTIGKVYDVTHDEVEDYLYFFDDEDDDVMIRVSNPVYEVVEKDQSTTNNNQVNWDEIPEDVEAVVTFEDGDEPGYYKMVDGRLQVQCYRSDSFYCSSFVSIERAIEYFGDRFHLRPSPITEPTPEVPESTPIETSEVGATTTPEFDWSSVNDDVEAVVVNPQGRLMAVFKEETNHLLIGSGLGRWYVTRRSNTIDKYPLEQLKTGDGILIRRPPAITTPEVDMYDMFKGADSKPSISTILQEAQQSILKHHGVTGKVKFTVTCS